MIIQHNMSALNTNTQLGINNNGLMKSAERLSSGYRVNRAADDAAALAISEKKRAQIRGLARASRNAQDGISFVQTGDGAMSQMEDILQRMRELTVQALNSAVYQPEDQAAMQMEFDELQSEIDRINDQTEFNRKSVFEHYTENYSLMEGNRVWSQSQRHTIDSSNSSLTVKYVVVDEDGTETEKEMTLTIAEGTYTTQELMDEMDDVVAAMGDGADGLYLEYTDKHTCNMVLQDGKEIKDVTGGLSYLFFDSYGGNKSGALIGTTVFYPGNPLMVVDGKNDLLQFRIDFFDGTSKDVTIKVAEDGYTRNDMIKYLNGYTLDDGKTLADYGMTAKEYGDASIQISGDTGIITGLRGNMFEIDDQHYDSVFYDNTKYGSVYEVPAVFTGADVLNQYDASHNTFVIESGKNDTLTIKVDGGNYKTIQLDAGSYSLSAMQTQLQNKLNNAGLGITVSTHFTNNVTTPNGNRISQFCGLTLTSNSKGKESKIEFDVPNSSAYDTLFVERKYTDVGKTPTIVTGLWQGYGSTPYVTGGMEFDGGSDFPLILDDTNNSFVMEVTEWGEETKKISIALSTQTPFNNMDDLIQEINSQLAKTEYADRIQATSYNGNKIQLISNESASNGTISKIYVSKDKTDGYNVLFEGESVTYPSGKDITLLSITPGEDGKISFTDTNNKLTVVVGGETRTVTVTPGAYTPEELVKELNKTGSALIGKSSESYPTADTADYGRGNTVGIYNTYGAGSDVTLTNTGQDGSGGKADGSTQIKDGKPAWCQLGGSITNSTKIDSTNDKFSIKVNGKQYDITLTRKDSYTQSELVKELQEKLDAKTSEANKVKVSVVGNKLKFETVATGEGRTITTVASSFLTSVNTSKTSGYVTTSSMASLSYPLTFSSSNNDFTISIDGKATTVKLSTSKTYNSLSDIQTELNSKLSSKGVSVSVYGSGLMFTRTEGGNGKSVSLNINSCGKAGELIFKTPASDSLTPVERPKAVTVDGTKKNGTVKYSVTLADGNTYTATLSNSGTTAKTDTAASLATTLSGAVWKLNDTGTGKKASDLGFTVSASGNQLLFQTTDRGSGAYINASVKSGPIITTTPTIEASLVKNPDGTVAVRLKSDSSFTPKAYNKSAVLQPQKGTVTKAAPTYGIRSFTTRKYTLTTNRPSSLPATIAITDDNNELNFTYNYSNGDAKEIHIELEKKKYSRAELQKVLQEKLDAALEEDAAHKGEGLKVTVGNQIVLEAKKAGKYSMASLGGGFYSNVMVGTEDRTIDEKTAYSAGKLAVEDVYIAGRKDVRSGSTRIEKGENDELNMDITINGKVTTLEMVLDPGTYDSSSLIEHLQKKLAEALEKNNLPRNMILAGVGVFDSGVEGTDDSNSLFFYLNKKLDLEPGTYGIDGLTGKALFSIFYKTAGDPIPAYMTGTRDISGGMEIKEGENEFSVDVDGKTYTYEIPEGTYETAEELAEAVNQAIIDAGDDSCLKAGLSNNMLKLSYTKLGEHTINNIQGSAKTALFYEKKGRYDEDVDGWLQIGANEGQGIELERYCMSTLSMGINSVCITKHKYANKALQKIDGALKYLNEKRSKYGAMQNRLEYAMKVDDIAAENTQSSESKDRDTDMASEMVRYSKYKILQQVSESILSQANQSTQAILSLLG